MLVLLTTRSVSITHHPQDYRTRRASEARGRGVIVNSSSRIDRTARLMFPLSFTAFNILYWLSYSQVISSGGGS